MLLNVYSIFDVKAKIYSNPFFMSHNGQALRAFSDLVTDSKSMINKHPTDYMLYRLAEFDDNAGIFTALKNPEFLANAVDFVEKGVIQGG